MTDQSHFTDTLAEEELFCKCPEPQLEEEYPTVNLPPKDDDVAFDTMVDYMYGRLNTALERIDGLNRLCDRLYNDMAGFRDENEALNADIDVYIDEIDGLLAELNYADAGAKDAEVGGIYLDRDDSSIAALRMALYDADFPRVERPATKKWWARSSK